MAAPYDAISRKKLRELESDLTQMFQSSPVPTTEGGSRAQAEEAAPSTTVSLHNDMARRFEFLNNLFSLEMETHPGDKPDHLYHMANRLAYLEDAYHKWALFGTSPFEQPLDSVSLCSCTSSCFDEGDEQDWMELSYEEAPPVEGGSTEPNVPRSVEGGTRTNEENGPAHARKTVWTLGAIMVLLAAVAAGLVLARMWVTEDKQQFLLVPT